MAIIGTMSVGIVARTEQLQAGMAKASAAVRGFGISTKKTGVGFQSQMQTMSMASELFSKVFLPAEMARRITSLIDGLNKVKIKLDEVTISSRMAASAFSMQGVLDAQGKLGGITDLEAKIREMRAGAASEINKLTAESQKAITEIRTSWYGSTAIGRDVLGLTGDIEAIHRQTGAAIATINNNLATQIERMERIRDIAKQTRLDELTARFKTEGKLLNMASISAAPQGMVVHRMAYDMMNRAMRDIPAVDVRSSQDSEAVDLLKEISQRVGNVERRVDEQTASLYQMQFPISSLPEMLRLLSRQRSRA